MGLRDQITEVIAAAEGRYDNADADTLTDAVMWIVHAALADKDARIQKLEAQNEFLQRRVDTAHGKRAGTWDTWGEHIARQQAMPLEPPPKPSLTLEEARRQAAEHARALEGEQ